MDKKVKEIISGLQSGMTALMEAVGQNRYEDGESFGNPVQDYDDKDVDMGGEETEEGEAETKKKKFIAMTKAKMGGM